MTPIVAHRKGRKEALHEPSQIRLFGLQEAVEVVDHNAVGPDSNMIPFGEIGEFLKQQLPVGIIAKNRKTEVAPIDDVVTSTRKFNSQRFGHVEKIALILHLSSS